MEELYVRRKCLNQLDWTLNGLHVCVMSDSAHVWIKPVIVRRIHSERVDAVSIINRKDTNIYDEIWQLLHQLWHNCRVWLQVQQSTQTNLKRSTIRALKHCFSAWYFALSDKLDRITVRLNSLETWLEIWKQNHLSKVRFWQQQAGLNNQAYRLKSLRQLCKNSNFESTERKMFKSQFNNQHSETWRLLWLAVCLWRLVSHDFAWTYSQRDLFLKVLRLNLDLDSSCETQKQLQH